MRTRSVLALTGLVLAALILASGIMSQDVSTSARQAGEIPVAQMSEQLSDGMLDVQVYAPGDLGLRLEIMFAPDRTDGYPGEYRPSINLAMAAGHLDGLDMPLETVRAGVWRSAVRLPRAGRWMVGVGIGEEFVEVEIDVK